MQVLANRIVDAPRHHSLVQGTRQRLDESGHPVDRADLMDGGTRARMMVDLQRRAGNVAVQALLAVGGGRLAVQRCGPTPCDCPADQKAAAAAVPQEGVVEAGPAVQEQPAERSG